MYNESDILQQLQPLMMFDSDDTVRSRQIMPSTKQLSSELPAKRRKRDPRATREIILNAATSVLAKDGPDALSVSKVARVAGINRGTAYQHFQKREDLVKATVQWVGLQIISEVFTEQGTGEKLVPHRQPIQEVVERIVGFAMKNPDLGRIWLFDVLASDDPASDPFFKLFKDSTEMMTKAGTLEEGVDSEALSVIMLAGYFLWPVWVRAHAQSDKDKKKMAQRMSREALRLCMYGVLKPKRYPHLQKLLNTPAEQDSV